MFFFLLLIITVISGSPLGTNVIRDVGITQQQDMAKALAMSQRFFWRNMMEKWGCYYGIKIQPHQIRAKSEYELKEICGKWKLKAMAADAYVKSWECLQQKQQQASSSSSSAAVGPFDGSSSSSAAIIHDQIRAEDSEYFRFDCLCVKPRFQLEHGEELHMSSAMEAIKAAYRVLFGWSGGETFGPIGEIIFENQLAWDVVDRWLNAHNEQWKFSGTKAQMEKTEKMLLIGKRSVEEDEYFDMHKILNMPDFFDAPQRSERYEETLQTLLAATNEVKYEETFEDGTTRNYFVEIKNLMKQFKKMNKKLVKRVNRGAENDLKLSTDVKMAHENYLAIWELVQELGLNLSSICDASIEYKTNFVDNNCILKHFWMTKTKAAQFFGKFEAYFSGDPKHLITEIELGPLLWLYKHVISDPMVEKHPDELDNQIVVDPCEEAKLKVK